MTSKFCSLLSAVIAFLQKKKKKRAYPVYSGDVWFTVEMCGGIKRFGFIIVAALFAKNFTGKCHNYNLYKSHLVDLEGQVNN